VFRSSILARNPACLEQLVKTRGVRTIVNLYSGDLIAEGPLAAEEADAFTRVGGHSYIRILGLSDYPTPTESIADIQARIASAIELIRAAPGNVLVHCVGGIHRTGEVYGILQKCFNRLPMEAIQRDYVHHAGGAIEGNPEYRAVDVDIIRSFDCRRLAP
jgi:protein tyrosine/serine phosphatase